MIHDPRKGIIGPTEHLHDLPTYRKYLMPTAILVVCCLIAASFHASGLPRWREWGWSKAELALFLLVGVPFAGVLFGLVLYPLLARYGRGR